MPAKAPRDPNAPRDPVVLERLSDVFRLHGYEGASLSLLARATGLGRASLYHHFPGGKEEMAVAVAEHIARCFRERYLAPLVRPGAPAQRIRGMCAELDEFYERGKKPCLINAFVMGEAAAPIRDRVRAALNAWREGLAAVLREAGVSAAVARERADDALIRIQGALVFSRALDDTKSFRSLLRELPTQLLQPSA